MDQRPTVVLLKTDLSPTGGLEKATQRIAQEFLKRGANLSILSAPESISRWPKFRRLERFDAFARDWVREHKPDVVFGMDRNREQTHLRAGNGVHAAYLETRAWSKRITASFSPFHTKILELERAAFTYPGLQKVFTNSHMVRDEILRFYPIDPSKIAVIHNGVEWEEMQTDFDEWQEKKSVFLRDQNLDPSQFHFLFIGNGYARKGLTQLLHAFSTLKEGHLCVVGKESHEDRYRALANQLGLQKRVSFFGPQREIRKFYQYADAAVIPSLYDPFANVTVEALAMGIFVISSKRNGGHEVLTPENGEVIADLFDPDSVRASLEKPLRAPKTAARAFAIRESVKRLSYSKQMDLLFRDVYPHPT